MEAGIKGALWTDRVSELSLFMLIDSGSLETVPCNATPAGKDDDKHIRVAQHEY